MQNLDITVLTVVTSALLIFFFWITYREFSSVNKNGYAHNPNGDGYGRESVFFALKSIYENKPTLKKEKRCSTQDDPYAVILKNIADMEAISEDVKQGLEKIRENLYCEYSDLPSTESYEK